MFRTAIIHPFLYRYPRGIERYTVNLSSALVRLGNQVDILTWRWPQPLTWDELDGQVNVYAFPTARYYAASFIVPFYLQHLFRHHYDMVYIHFADYGEAATLQMLNFLGRQQPYSIVLHFPYSQVPHRYESFRESVLLKGAEEIVAVSDFVAREAEQFSSRSCAVISHGVDTKRFKPDPVARQAVRAELDMPEGAPLLLTVAALEERKGVQWVIRALPAILREHPQTKYVIVGDGPYLAQLQSLSQQLGVAQATHFLMPGTQVVRLYQAADLFLILSRGEASSIVSLEAMACEIPVLASRHPPFVELIGDEWGRQIDEQNKEAVIENILELLSDQAGRLNMGRAGREQIHRNHTWKMVAAQYLDLL